MLNKLADDIGKILKAVLISLMVGSVGKPETRKVGSDNKKLFAQLGNQLSKHMARRWEAVKKENGRRFRVSRFPKKYVKSVELNCVLGTDIHRGSDFYSVS